jgi:predicted TIM-barrel fold metal-dependent hydrolase|tara:strand:- start:2951 stop:3730 length:780 start_codon:yes stop_codon:yes gene_type:complete
MIDLNNLPVFDCHLHIIERGYPLFENNGYIPDEYTVVNYLSRVSDYNIQGGVVVSGSFQGFDQTYLVNALEKLGSRFVGVTQLPVTSTDDEILKLSEIGVRAVRFNLNRGGSADVNDLITMATRIYDLAGWHVELYLGPKSLNELKEQIPLLPKVCIDHLAISDSNLEILLPLIREGLAIKATGFGRLDMDIPETLKRIHEISPDTLMFGTDLPSTRAPRIYSDQDLLTIVEALGERESKKVMSQNALKFYDMTSHSLA